MAREATRRESAKVAKRTRAAGLAGVHVILDAGHGGNDPGTAHDDLWESAYVYDVACRVRRLLEKDSDAKVSMTTRSKKHGFCGRREERPRGGQRSLRADHAEVPCSTTPSWA